MSNHCGRLAPSPTGRLHLGHARSLLAAWWSARSRGGSVLLRIEDLDESRCRREYQEGLLEDLAWLGIDWDGKPIVQTDRQNAHRAAFERLRDDGWIYPCVCTRKDIQRALSAPHREDLGSAYPGTCRDRFGSAQEAWRATGGEPAWRFRRDRLGSIAWQDRLHGAQREAPADSAGDFVVWTKSGRAAYQLAVVVDDAAQGVSEVVRAKDLIPSTHQQVALQTALGLPTPEYAHLGMVLGTDGQRLAKRRGSYALAELRAQGLDAHQVIAWIGESLGQGAADLDGIKRGWDWSQVNGEDRRAPVHLAR